MAWADRIWYLIMFNVGFYAANLYAYRYTSLTIQSIKGRRSLSSSNGSLPFDSMKTSSSSWARFETSG